MSKAYRTFDISKNQYVTCTPLQWAFALIVQAAHDAGADRRPDPFSEEAQEAFAILKIAGCLL